MVRTSIISAKFRIVALRLGRHISATNHEGGMFSCTEAMFPGLLTGGLDDDKESSTKITVIGCGQVGMASAVSCLSLGLTSDLCLYDMNKDKLKGEVLDLQHASLFLKGPRITAAHDLSDTAHSKLVIITAGGRQRKGEKRPELLGRNVEIFKSFVPQLVKHSPDAVFLVVTNPVDVMTYVTWKLSGLPKGRVIGSGTNLDTSRFRFLLGQKLKINVNEASGWIIGEHGDSSVAVWSGVTVAGVPLRAFQPKAGEPKGDPHDWAAIHKCIINAAYEVIALKGYTSWAVGFSVGQISEAIIKNSQSIHPVSIPLKGHYGVKEDLIASVPCILGEHGLVSVINLPLTETEIKQFENSMKAISDMQKDIKDI